MVGACIAINFGMDDPAGAGERFTSLWPLTQPYWFNPLIALVAIVPAVVFGARAGRAFGLRTKAGSAAIAFAVGIVAWSLGNLVWFWYNTCTAWGSLGCDRAIEAPYPSVADVGFLLLLPCYAFAMIQLARMLAIGWRDVVRLSWIPILAFAITGYLMFPEFTVLGVNIPNRSFLFSDGYTTSQTAFSVLYLVSDAALLSLALINLVRSRSAAGGLFFRAVLVTSIGLVLQYVADTTFNVRVSNGTQFAGDIADLTYFAALFVVVLGIHLFGRAHSRIQAQLEQLAAAMELEPFGESVDSAGADKVSNA